MTEESLQLPKFASPPLVETVMGVFFKPVAGLGSVEQSVFWNEVLKERFPQIEERPPVDEVREYFTSGHPRSAASPEWRLVTRLPSPRLWIVAAGGEQVVQLQRNMLLTNWLRKPGTAYWSYQERRQDFLSHYGAFVEFALRRTRHELAETSCVVTYVNQIPITETTPAGRQISRILECWQGSEGTQFGSADHLSLNYSVPFSNRLGRLHVDVKPDFRTSDRQLVVRMELTGRVMLGRENPMKISTALDVAHDAVVRGFADATTSTMHQEWGLEDVDSDR